MQEPKFKVGDKLVYHDGGLVGFSGEVVEVQVEYVYSVRNKGAVLHATEDKWKAKEGK